MLLWENYSDLFLGNDLETFQILQSRCSGTSQPNENKIISYLSSDLDFAAAGLVPKDRFSGCDLPSSLTWRSDGVWVWSNALEYYVRSHHFKISSDFALHLAARNWIPPDLKELDVNGIEENFAILRS